MKKFIQFKDKEDHELFFMMNPLLMIVACDIAHYCRNAGMPFTITATLSSPEEDLQLERISDTHSTGRAFDIRTRDWEKSFSVNLCDYFEEKYSELAAITNDGKKRLMVLKFDHIHVQLARQYSVY